MQYLPYGENFVSQRFTRYSIPYKFSGKEKDDETQYSYFGARYYDSDLSIWLSVDALGDKFPSLSPYTYCYNNPVGVFDPNGKEGIVVSGAPGSPDDGGHSNKVHFLINGLDRARDAKNHLQKNGEKVTWIIYNGGPSGANQDPKLLANYKKIAEKEGINVKVVTEVDEIVNYVNAKNGGDSRSKDKISSFYYVGHATPGDLDVGYAGSGEDFDPDEFKSDAFSSGCYIDLVGGCRTSVPGIFENSVETQFQDKVDKKSTIKGSNVRVVYSGGVRTDEDLVRPNNGKIDTRKGNSKTH